MGEHGNVIAHAARDGVVRPETLDLDAAGLADRRLRPRRDAWVLAGDGVELEVGGACGARMRLVRHGITCLLVGANGYPSVLAAIRAARGGETVLVAPGTYREEQSFVIDRSITLQGVSEQGEPVVHAGEVVATIIALRPGTGGAGFAIKAPGVTIQGLSFIAMERPRVGFAGADANAGSQVRLLNAAGRLRRNCEDVQTALDAAEAGDRIQIPEGRHVGDLFIRTSVTLSGRNAGRPGRSSRREIEATLLGHVVMGTGAGSVVIDGLVIWGSFTMEPDEAGERRLAVRNCVIDGRDSHAAIHLARGTSSEIVNNLILGGSTAAIRIACGFDGLSICGNHIETPGGAAGIALHGGPRADRVEILGNTFLDGNYGVLLHAGNLGQLDDSVVLSGNHFGERGGGAPLVAAIHADGVLPGSLEASLGASLALNTYHAMPPAADVDLLFERPDGSVVAPSFASVPAQTLRQSGHGR
jgi:nitrous oxidase accessory protein NosD